MTWGCSMPSTCARDPLRVLTSNSAHAALCAHASGNACLGSTAWVKGARAAARTAARARRKPVLSHSAPTALRVAFYVRMLCVSELSRAGGSVAVEYFSSTQHARGDARRRVRVRRPCKSAVCELPCLLSAHGRVFVCARAAADGAPSSGAQAAARASLPAGQPEVQGRGARSVCLARACIVLQPAGLAPAVLARAWRRACVC